jgi:hypothetical protein
MKTNKNLFQAILILCLISLFWLPAGNAQAQANPAQIGVFEPLITAPDAVLEIPIQVKDIQNMYAIDLEMRFDPAVLQAQDADSNQPGVQLGFGSFLDPGLLLYNTVDNTQGIVRLVMSQVNPSEPKSGSGILFVLYVKGMQAGVTDLKITNLQVADRGGVEIPTTKVENTVTVDEAAPGITATAIPVINPTAMIIIPTLAPTPTATLTPQPTATRPLPTSAPTQAGTSPAKNTVETAAPVETDRAGFSLLDNWWIVLLVLAIAGGLGFYLVRNRSKS